MHVYVDNSQYSNWRAIVSVAIPAAILNAAAPLTALVQAGLLGTYVGTSALAAYAAVSITAGFATRVFNFLVDGVSAKTGKSVGLRAWSLVAARVRMSLGFALAAGIIAAFTLLSVIRPVSVNILQLTPEVQQEAHAYWILRVILVPVVLQNMALSGILQGFRHVKTAALINTCQALAEMAGSTLVLRHNWHIAGRDGLFAMGIVTFVTQVAAWGAGGWCMLRQPPPEAPEGYNLWNELVAWGGSGNGSGSGSREREEELGTPLLVRASLPTTPRRPLSVASSSSAATTTTTKKNSDEAAAAAALAEAFGQQIHSRIQNEMDVAYDIEVRKAGIEEEVEPSMPLISPSTVLVLASGGRGEGEGKDAAIPSHALVGDVDSLTSTPQSEPASTSTSTSTPQEQHLPPDASRMTSAVGMEGLVEAQEDESLLDFVKDGLNMFVRSMILQITFFGSLVAASRLGTESLAAHSVVNQLWVLISYAVDGWAAAGIVLGSRLAAQAHDTLHARSAKRHLQLLMVRVLSAGLLAGIFAGVVFSTWRNFIISLFTQDPEAVAVLCTGTWHVLVLAQPINGLVFVYDGLMYASQSFTFIRNYMILGFIVVFCPLLSLELVHWRALWGVWVANAAINAWRAAGAAYLIHYIFMKEFDDVVSRHASMQELRRDEEEG